MSAQCWRAIAEDWHTLWWSFWYIYLPNALIFCIINTVPSLTQNRRWMYQNPFAYENPLLFITSILVKFRFSEKATKFEKNLPLVLTLLGENSCFVKTGGIFFQILWRSHNVLTLATDWFWKSRLYFAQQRRLPQFLTVYALRFSVLHLFTRKKIKPFFFLTISCETRHNGSKVFIM